MTRYLLWFVTCLLSTLGFAFLFMKINGITKINKRSILVFFGGVIYAVICNALDIQILKSTSFFIFFPILFYSIKQSSLKRLIINVLVIWVIGVILDITSMLLTSTICGFFNIHFDTSYELFHISLTIFIFVIIMLISKSKKIINLIKKLINFLFHVNYSNFTLIMYGLLTLIVDLFMVLNLHKINIGILLFLVVILLLVIFVLLIIFRLQDDENKKYLATLKENNDFYIKMDDENRIFKHNLMAKLSSIKSVSNQKAINLIDDYVVKMNENVNYTSKVKIIPYGLNGIIYQNTYPYLEDINFKISNKIDFDIFEFLKPRRYNVMVEKLVLCLDNAREASLNSKDKIIVINLYDDENNIYIEIKNTFSNNLDIDSLGSKSYSTKGEKRGLGLFSMLRNSEVSMNVKVVNNYFISTLVAKKQKNSTE